VLLGYWLDQKLDTSPWLLLGGSLMGIVAGFYHFFKIVLYLDKKSKTGDDNNGKPASKP
jgi:ATP synthase protein I